MNTLTLLMLLVVAFAATDATDTWTYPDAYRAIYQKECPHGMDVDAELKGWLMKSPNNLPEELVNAKTSAERLTELYNLTRD